MCTLDAKVESIELEIFAGLNKDHTFDAASRVIELFLCFDIDFEALVVRVGVSHVINNDSNTGNSISIKNFVCSSTVEWAYLSIIIITRHMEQDPHLEDKTTLKDKEIPSPDKTNGSPSGKLTKASMKDQGERLPFSMLTQVYELVGNT